MASPNPNPSRGEKRKRSPGPTEVSPEAPPTRAAYVVDSDWKLDVLMYLLNNYEIQAFTDLYPNPGAYLSCNSDTLEEYVQAVYKAKSDVDRKACKSILDSPKAFAKHPAELSLDDKAREGFLKAFSETYKDDRSCLKTFTDFIDTCAAGWRPENYLAPYTSLVQSSGTGKSRLVKEFANERYVIYCCLRATGSSGVPARSWIANVLIPASSQGHERLKGFLLYAAFFCACMDRLAAFLKETANRTERVWCEMQLREEKVGQTNYSGVGFWKEIHERMTLFQDTVRKERAFDDEAGFTALLESNIRSSCTKLLESFSSSGLEIKGKALLTFALDESKSLLGEYGATTHFSIFRWMASSLKQGCGIFIVLLDTTSEVSNFMASAIPDSSFRYSEKSTKLFPAFYEVDTFNILAPKERIWTVLGDSPSDLTSVLFKHFMIGRPLFGSYLQSGSDDKVSEAGRLANVVQLAAEKLLGGIAAEQGMQGPTDYHLAVALLSVRAAVFVKPQSELASSLVAKHLGMCLAISSDRRLVFTGYPSEPVLAEAACRIMNRRSKLDVGEILGPMLPYVREGIVEGGPRGELVARILFLLAWDRACKNDTSEYEPRFTISRGPKVLYTRPLVVREFLHSLADKGRFDAALEGQIDQKEMERFLKGRVFFTHFTSVTYSVERSGLIDFYERGVAIMCKRNQPAVDMIIPVRLGQDDMSYILVQVRNYTHADSKINQASLDVRPEKAGLSTMPADYPYLALYLQLGYRTGDVRNLKHEKNLKHETHHVADRDAMQGVEGEASGRGKDPFQMIIGLFSLKPAVYPCLRDEVKQAYGTSEESMNSEHLSSLCRAWNDALSYVESIEPVASGESTPKHAKLAFVKHTCDLTYESSPSGS